MDIKSDADKIEAPMTDTPQPLTTDELDEVRERVAKATPGPWYLINTDDALCMNAYIIRSVNEEPDDPGEDHMTGLVATTLLQTPGYVRPRNYVDNGEFIAHARTDVPRLLATVTALQAQINVAWAKVTGLQAIVGRLRGDLDDHKYEAEISMDALQAEVARLQAQHDAVWLAAGMKMDAPATDVIDMLGAMEREMKRLQAEVARLREALEFYAYDDSWKYHWQTGGRRLTSIEVDGGRRARAALSPPAAPAEPPTAAEAVGVVVDAVKGVEWAFGEIVRAAQTAAPAESPLCRNCGVNRAEAGVTLCEICWPDGTSVPTARELADRCAAICAAAPAEAPAAPAGAVEKLIERHGLATDAELTAAPAADPEPHLPSDECTTADMLRKVAKHLESGAFEVKADMNAKEWIDGLRSRAALLEAAPAADAGGLAEAIRAINPVDVGISGFPGRIAESYFRLGLSAAAALAEKRERRLTADEWRLLRKWAMDSNRQPADLSFTSGLLRDVAAVMWPALAEKREGAKP